MGVVPRPHERHHRYAEESPVFDRDSLVDTTEYIKYLFLALDPTSIMPGRTAAKKRTAQRDWMIEQKTKASKQQTEEEEQNDSDNDSGVEDKEVEEVEETIAEALNEEKPAEDDGPVEDWSKKELMDECNRLEISNKGNKNALIERIKEAWANKKLAIIEEVAVEKVDETEEAVEESLPAEPASEEIIEETLPETEIVEDSQVEKMEDDADTDKSKLPEEEDGLLEDWTKKEVAEECKTLGLSDKGNKASLIERIKEARAKNETIVEPEIIEDKSVEDVTAEETEEVVSTENEIESEQTSVETEVEVEEAVVSEPVIGESTLVDSETEAANPEEDAPIEEWTKKELVEECKNLGISDKGNKAVLIEIIKETWANKKEIAETAAPLEAEEAPVVEAEDAPVAETATEPEATETAATEKEETD